MSNVTLRYRLQGDEAMNRGYVIMAIIAPTLLVISGVYLYSITATHPEKPVVVLPTKYVGNIYYFDITSEYYTFDNDTPLSHYWYQEFLKLCNWPTINITNISVTVTPQYLGYEGTRNHQGLSFYVLLNSSEYIEKVTYISDARYIEEKNGATSVFFDVPEEYSNRVTKYLAGYGNSYKVVIFNVHQSNFTMKTYSYADIYERRVKGPLPYNFTAYIETKDKIYRMEFIFNLTDEPYPLIDLYELYHLGNDTFDIPGATFFCYNSTWGKVIISDHFVKGTEYYFVEKNGTLSEIWSVEEVKYYGR